MNESMQMCCPEIYKICIQNCVFPNQCHCIAHASRPT